tara:strand:- start:8184 stop:8828 length:645 start_codon:yes stop_codon:yes gene_type:complete
MSALATRAFARKKKVTKARAMEIIERLQATTGDVEGLSELYSYFKPTSPSKPKTDQQWVSKAIGKNDVRNALNRLQVEDGQMIGCDGHRVHVCNTELPNGAYDNQFNLIDDAYAGKFPDWKRVIPSNRPGKISLDAVVIKERHTAIPGYADGSVIKGHFLDLQLGETLIRLNGEYWNDATCMFTGKAEVRYGTNNDSILINEDGKRAVVMPIRP